MNLKPCPFCGGEARTGYGLNDYNRWGVGCKTCSATVEVEEWNGVEDTEENAISAWNKRTVRAHPIDDWHEDCGDVLWWTFPISEPPYCGSPMDLDWPNYHTHWTPLILPKAPDPNE